MATATKKPPQIPIPSHLSHVAKTYWTAVQTKFGIEDESGLRLLQSACECLDAADRARVGVDKYGQTFTDRLGNVRPRPEVKIQRDSILAFKAILRELRLDPESMK